MECLNDNLIKMESNFIIEKSTLWWVKPEETEECWETFDIAHDEIGMYK